MSPVFSLLRSPINPLARMYPAPPYPQIQPIQNYRIREEGGTPLPEIPVGGNHDEGFPVDEGIVASSLSSRPPLTYVKLLYLRSCARNARKDMHNDRALIGTTERSTIPVCANIATLNGVAPTSIGLISKSIIPRSTVMRF